MRDRERTDRWAARSTVPHGDLGHSTLAMVKRYQHVLPGLTVAAAERMDKVMGR